MSDIVLPGDPGFEAPKHTADTEPSTYDFSRGDLAEKVKELKDIIGMDKEELTPEAEQARMDSPEESGIPGSEVNWDDYELPPGYAHMYPRSVFMETPEGPKFVVEITEFHSERKDPVGALGAGGLNKLGHPKNLGEYLTYLTNGAERWQIASILPTTMGDAIIVFQRKIKVTLPDPVLIEKEVKVEKPTDEELKEIEDKSVSWASVGSEEPEHEEQESGTPGEVSGEVGNLSE